VRLAINHKIQRLKISLLTLCAIKFSSLSDTNAF
jgi:hypothetical protein